MQVLSFGHYLPRVLVVIRAKFGEIPMTDLWFLAILACKVCQDRTCLDKPGHIRPKGQTYLVFLVYLALHSVN
jgi:hypothetical protein